MKEFYEHHPNAKKKKTFLDERTFVDFIFLDNLRCGVWRKIALIERSISQNFLLRFPVYTPFCEWWGQYYSQYML